MLRMETSKHVIYDIQRVSKDIVELIKVFPTATIHEAYGAKGALCNYIKPIHSDMKLCGPVITVKANPRDNLIVHKHILSKEKR
jgi:4-hydroxy-4-methyl-2-oxoglutarate aldolase